MGNVVSLDGWRQARNPAPQSAPAQSAHPPAAQGLERLEQAADRLHGLVTRKVNRGPSLDTKLETELLAIIGELTVGLVEEAAGRAERLASRLEARGAGAN
jgi:hypothetical protein